MKKWCHNCLSNETSRTLFAGDTEIGLCAECEIEVTENLRASGTGYKTGTERRPMNYKTLISALKSAIEGKDRLIDSLAGTIVDLEKEVARLQHDLKFILDVAKKN